MNSKSALLVQRWMLQPRVLLILILLQFIIHFFTFIYLYKYVTNVENDLRALRGRYPETMAIPRRRRSSALPIAEDNAVSDLSGRIREDKELQGTRKVTASPMVSGSASSSTTAGDWVWLRNADTAIHADVIENFCRSSAKYCPPGAPGEPGEQGLRGIPGAVGPMGPPGQPGARGPKGDIGPPGFDGRDGVPGEPGLDGIPGRSGLDGLPGTNGEPGMNGMPGMPGRNGTDGRPGERGPQGPVGPRGEQGPPGHPGLPGRDGKPGIQAWSSKDDILIPPSILGITNEITSSNASSVITVQEGSSIRLRCAASGKPHPMIQWTRLDGSVIPMGTWHVNAITSHTFNISVVNREHMGDYVCNANNGIDPPASKKLTLHVRFSPFIRIRNQIVTVKNQNSALLECEVEAFPEPIVHWERGDGRRLNKISDKYRMDVYDNKRDHYKLKMKLRISRVTSMDHGTYHCVAKNEIDVTKGYFVVSDDVKDIEKQRLGKDQYITFGHPMPSSVDQEQEVCSPCTYTNLDHVRVQPLRGSETTRQPLRIETESLIEAVGKPVLKGSMNDTYGIWMYDASSRHDSASDKLWVTRNTNTSYIYEHKSKDHFKNGTANEIRLPCSFQGNGHVVYNNSFFYNPKDRPTVFRFDLDPFSSHGCNCSHNSIPSNCEVLLPDLKVNTPNFLYKHNFTYVDFNVDENGMWVIYGLSESNNTAVIKLDPVKMNIQYGWNISIDHHRFGEMFIAGGVLYAIHSVSEEIMKIRFAFDLYKNSVLDTNLSFTNPYHKTTAVSYNHKTKELYTWNKGNQLAYPVKYRDDVVAGK